MNDIEKVRRHISPLVPITLKNQDGTEDTFHLKSLNMAQQARAHELSKKFRQFEGIDNPEDLIDEELINECFDFVFGIVKESFDDIDDKTLEEFTNSNFEEIFANIDDLIPKSKNSKNIDLIKKRIEERKIERQNK